MPQPLVISSMVSTPDYQGTELGTTQWFAVAQDRIEQFARASGDTRWIHLDAERAARESPWKSTVADGFLLLSLVPGLLPQLIVLRGWSTRRAAARTFTGPARARAGRQRLPPRPRHLVRGRGQPDARVPRARELRLLRVVMRIALAQLNPTVGDLAGNRRLVEEAAAKAATERADLLVAPEMVLTGYPPMDLLERDDFVRDQLRELDALAASSRQVAIALGAVLPIEGGRRGVFHNACVLLRGGRQVAARAKTHLPTYDVFNEHRYFAPAERREPVPFGGGDSDTILGLTVCEDTWVEPQGYAVDPVGELARAGANLVLNPSCSPWHAGKARERRGMIARLAGAAARVPRATSTPPNAASACRRACAAPT